MFAAFRTENCNFASGVCIILILSSKRLMKRKKLKKANKVLIVSRVTWRDESLAHMSIPHPMCISVRYAGEKWIYFSWFFFHFLSVFSSFIHFSSFLFIGSSIILYRSAKKGFHSFFFCLFYFIGLWLFVMGDTGNLPWIRDHFRLSTDPKKPPTLSMEENGRRHRKQKYNNLLNNIANGEQIIQKPRSRLLDNRVRYYISYTHRHCRILTFSASGNLW